MSIAFFDQKCKANSENTTDYNLVASDNTRYMPYSSRLGHFVILILCLALSLSVGLYKLKMMRVSAIPPVNNQAGAAGSIESTNKPGAEVPEGMGQGDIKQPIHIIDRGETWRYQP